VSFSGSERGYLAALGAVIIWALVPVATRFFVLRVDPFVFNVIRFAASGAAAAPLFAYAKPWRWPARDQMLLAWCSVLAVPGYNIPVALGARTVPASELGLIIATEPVFIVVFTLLLKRRRVRLSVIGGSVVALGGVALTSGVLFSPASFKWQGTVQVLAGAASWSCYTVLGARLNERYGTFGATGAILVVGSAALLAISAPMIERTSWPGSLTTTAVAALGLASSTLGFLLWNYASACLPAERLGLFLYLIPVVCVAAGVLFLKESLTLIILIGGALTVFGVWVASRTPKRAKPAVAVFMQ
jgi:drug/metabolite transporter (DMT)-like permease